MENFFILGNHKGNNCGTIEIIGNKFDKTIDNNLILSHIINVFNNAILISETQFNCQQIIIKADLTGVSFNHIDTDFIKTLTIILQNRYPDRLYKCYISNPPIIFTSVWNLIKKLIDKNTRDKVVIRTSNKYDTKECITNISHTSIVN